MLRTKLLLVTVVALCALRSHAIAAPDGVPQLDTDRQNPNFVARVGDEVWAKDRITAELNYLPATFIHELKGQESAIRNYAIAWMHTQVYARAAEAEGFVTRVPGLADAARYDGGRRMIAREYAAQVAGAASPVQKPDTKELEQFYSLHKGICKQPTGYRFARILIEFPLRASPVEIEGAKGRADAAQKRIAAGEDFTAVENTTSDRPGRGPGGDVGWLTEDQLGSDPVGTAVRKLAPNEVTTDPIRTDRNFQIVKLLEKSDGKEISFAECRPILEARFVEKFSKTAGSDKISDLMKKFGAWMNVDNFVLAFRNVVARGVEPGPDGAGPDAGTGVSAAP